MAGGETLIAAFVVSRGAGHQLLLIHQWAANNFREKTPRCVASQYRDNLATSKNCDGSVFGGTESEIQIAVARRIHSGRGLGTGLRRANESSHRICNVLTHRGQRATVRGGQRVIAGGSGGFTDIGSSRLRFAILGPSHGPYGVQYRGLAQHRIEALHFDGHTIVSIEIQRLLELRYTWRSEHGDEIFGHDARYIALQR